MFWLNRPWILINIFKIHSVWFTKRRLNSLLHVNFTCWNWFELGGHQVAESQCRCSRNSAENSQLSECTLPTSFSSYQRVNLFSFFCNNSVFCCFAQVETRDFIILTRLQINLNESQHEMHEIGNYQVKQRE